MVLQKRRVVSYIDLFAGMGGFRIGFENGSKDLNIESKCVFTCEIKSHAISTYKKNFNEENIYGDITQINENDIPSFDYLLAGFPCQAFSQAGKKMGFLDPRGVLIFDILRILRCKKPLGFILENVPGLVTHNNGNTFKTILSELSNVGYLISWKILNSADFGVPQGRKRVYIVGSLNKIVDLQDFAKKESVIKDILEKNLEKVTIPPFVDTLLKYYSVEELADKTLSDSCKSPKFINSWNLELKGAVSPAQKEILELLLVQKNRISWSKKKGLPGMIDVPLTLQDISTFYSHSNLHALLEDLKTKGYLKYEYPKNIFIENNIKIKKYDTSKEKGYKLALSRFSFPIFRILSEYQVAPTILSSSTNRIVVATQNTLRNFTILEGLGLFGYPKDYKLDHLSYNQAFDLLGNTVTPPVITEIVKRLLKA